MAPISCEVPEGYVLWEGVENAGDVDYSPIDSRHVLVEEGEIRDFIILNVGMLGLFLTSHPETAIEMQIKLSGKEDGGSAFGVDITRQVYDTFTHLSSRTKASSNIVSGVVYRGS